MDVIATIGPSSNNPEILEKLVNRGVNFFRINLSHTEENDIENKIKDIMGYGIPIILDTEGSQVRSGNTSIIHFEEGAKVRLYGTPIACNENNIFLNPPGVMQKLNEGDLISIDFNSLLLKVYSVDDRHEGYIDCMVLIGGEIGGKKAVQIESPTFSLPPFSRKDHIALDLAKKYGIKHFTLSFMESPDSVRKFKEAIPEAKIYAKIESRKGLDNFIEIAKVADGILIDRGDLSSQVPLERIPLIQKYIIAKCKELNKEVIVATNTLEQMAFSLKPSKAEVSDIINIILDGATGIALTKETAVGKYPIETSNMIFNLIKQVEFINPKNTEEIIQKIEETDYINSPNVPELLVKPHGGVLVNRFPHNYDKEIPERKIEITEETLMDVEQIAIGAFSPLEGFLGKEDLESITNNMRLANGIVWPLPILLDVKSEIKSTLSEGEDVALTLNGEVYAILHLDEIYSIDKEEYAKKIFETLDLSHPGVKRFIEMGDYLLGGKITLLKRKNYPHKIHELTPQQARKFFAGRGWSKVLGFHTRNVIHRSHEFIQLEGLKRGLCDGLFVHPVIGKKKKGDFESNVIIESYEKMIEKFYPKSKVIMSTFATYSRYGGPREALFTAIARKNFGCSHFIVGRDHTGVGNFYNVHASHNIFDKFTKEEIGIFPVKFDKVFYSELQDKYVHEPDSIDHPEGDKLHISGTQARDLLQSGRSPPEWFMRPEITEIILNKIKSGEKVFVETENNHISKAKIIWFTGLSGSGKTTVADLLKEELEKQGKKVAVFDGDIVRKEINPHLGFTPEDIKENNKIIMGLCQKAQKENDFILVTIISPFKESRNLARQLFGSDFIEVFTSCSLDECKRRDVKGLYKKAESGEIPNFIGLHVPYEPPENPEIILNTSEEGISESVNKSLSFLSLK